MSSLGKRKVETGAEGENNRVKPQVIIDLTGDDDDVAKDDEEDDDGDDEDEDDEDDDNRHHPGDLEVDDESDYWADWDERCHGDRSANCIIRNHAEGYTWSCCDRPGDAPGCKRGPGPTLDEKYPDSSEPELDGGHTGELEPDYEGDCWADWDERCHGPIDSQTNRKEYPDNFVWSCCGRVGTYAKGCQGGDAGDY